MRVLAAIGLLAGGVPTHAEVVSDAELCSRTGESRVCRIAELQKTIDLRAFSPGGKYALTIDEPFSTIGTMDQQARNYARHLCGITTAVSLGPDIAEYARLMGAVVVDRVEHEQCVEKLYAARLHVARMELLQKVTPWVVGSLVLGTLL